MKGKKYGKRIKPISESRAARLRDYEKLKRAWFAQPENKFCAVAGCGRVAVHLHHSFGRSGALLCLQKHWTPLCSAHHNRCHGDIGWARQQKLLPAFGFNRIEVALASEPLIKR